MPRHRAAAGIHRRRGTVICRLSRLAVDAVLRDPSLQALWSRRWRWRQCRRCPADLGDPAQVGGDHWIWQRLDWVVPGDGVDE